MKYDLIVSTVDPGNLARAGKLYTVEFFEEIVGLLAPDGVFVFWSDSNLEAEANQILINSGAAVFEHQKVFSADRLPPGMSALTYFFVIHSPASLRYRALGFRLGAPFPGDLDIARLPRSSDSGRLLSGCAHRTTAVHSLRNPSKRLLFGGDHEGPVPLRPKCP